MIMRSHIFNPIIFNKKLLIRFGILPIRMSSLREA